MFRHEPALRVAVCNRRYSWLFSVLFTSCSISLLVTSELRAQTLYPTSSWTPAQPSDVGLSRARLDDARDFAGGNGFIVRNGRFVYSWGSLTNRSDLKSTTKSLGSALLGIALLDGDVDLDAPAELYHPTLGTPPSSNSNTGWIDEVTLRNLATHTAGFDVTGGYSSFIFRPDSSWSYSNGGPNWIAECLTLNWRRDLVEVLQERIWTPIGVDSGDWSWRSNAFRSSTIQGITSREFGSGIRANVEALTRFGYLFLRRGVWDGQRILPSSFIDASRQADPRYANLPEEDSDYTEGAPRHYNLLWWNNADGTMPNVPRDTYWSWGLGESLIIIIPSLDLVATRTGGSFQPAWQPHYSIIEPFFELLADAAGPSPTNLPPMIRSVVASPSTIGDDQTSRLSVDAVDLAPGPNSLSYRWSIPSGQGQLSSTSSRTPTFTPPSVDSDTRVTIRLEVRDGDHSIVDFIDVDVVEGGIAPNVHPVIDSVVASPSVIEADQTSLLSVSAHDPDSGPSGLSYDWQILSGGGSLSDRTSRTPTYSPPSVSSRRSVEVRVTVSDGSETSSDTLSLTVDPVDNTGGGGNLLSDTFADANLNGWTVVDVGNRSAPSLWRVSAAALVENSNLHSGPMWAEDITKLGTRAIWSAGSSWTDVRFRCNLTPPSDDDDSIGAFFRYRSVDNFYRFSWDKERRFRRLVKCVGGRFTLLAEDSVTYTPGRTYQLDISAVGSRLEVRVDGSLFTSVSDSSHAMGTVGLYTWALVGGRFDDVSVDRAAGSGGQNQAPVIRSITATPARISDDSTSRLMVDAVDPDGGPANLSYEWSLAPSAGSLSSNHAVSPVFTPAAVPQSRTTLVTVRVSDGLAETSDTVAILVDPADTGPGAAPVITSVSASPNSIGSSESSQLSALVSDADTPTASLVYHWSITAGGGSLNSNTSQTPQYTAPDVTSDRSVTIRLVVSDGARSDQATVQLSVLAVPPSTDLLLDADFSERSLAGWTIRDEGDRYAPSRWSAATGSLEQNSNIYKGPTAAEDPAKVGTELTWAAGTQWTDYALELDVETSSYDDDALGVLFRYRDANNYYRFSWDRQRNYRRLVKRSSGSFEVLAEEAARDDLGRAYSLRVAAVGAELSVSVDGTEVFHIVDSSHARGTVGLSTWALEGVRFDNIRVETLDDSSSTGNLAPLINSLTASPPTIDDNSTSLLRVTASDPDSGPQSLAYSWTIVSGGGSLNRSTSSSVTYTPPNLSSSRDVLLRVSVSDGADSVSGELSLRVVDATGTGLLLEERFTSGMSSQWTVVDLGNRSGPSNWRVASGELQQLSNIHSSGGDTVVKFGTRATWDDGMQWNDVGFTFRVRTPSGDDDTLGAFLRYSDDDNFYRFSWDRQRNDRHLVKCADGVFTVLAQDPSRWSLNREYTIEMRAVGNRIQVYVGGALLYDITDDSHSRGTVGLYTWGLEGAKFDDVLVEQR